METSIQTFIFTKSGIHHLNLFAYSSHGLPGVELIGLGSKGKLLKEKILYLTRKKQLKLPMKRFCLCIDPQTLPQKLSGEMIKNLEIPFLLMLWYLGGHLSIHQLDQCQVAGYFTIQGDFYFRSFDHNSNQASMSIGIGETIEAASLLADFDLRCHVF